MGEREYEALCSAPDSTRMEGFEVAEQAVRDGVRLLCGEMAAEIIIAEILSRST